MFSFYFILFFLFQGGKRLSTSNKEGESMFQENWLNELKRGIVVVSVWEPEKKNPILWVRLGDSVRPQTKWMAGVSSVYRLNVEAERCLKPITISVRELAQIGHRIRDKTKDSPQLAKPCCVPFAYRAPCKGHLLTEKLFQKKIARK